MKTTIQECPNCNARINARVSECPWCGIRRVDLPPEPLRKRMSLGALITIVTLVALLLGMIRFSQ